MRELTEAEQAAIEDSYVERGRSVHTTAATLCINEKLVAAFVKARGIKRTRQETSRSNPWRGRIGAEVAKAAGNKGGMR